MTPDRCCYLNHAGATICLQQVQQRGKTPRLLALPTPEPGGNKRAKCHRGFRHLGDHHTSVLQAKRRCWFCRSSQTSSACCSTQQKPEMQRIRTNCPHRSAPQLPRCCASGSLASMPPYAFQIYKQLHATWATSIMCRQHQGSSSHGSPSPVLQSHHL
jgi:hypothetical protein